MKRSSHKSRRINLPFLLLIFLCVAIVLFALSRLALRPTAQVLNDGSVVKLTVEQKPLASADTVVSNQKDVNLLRFEARARQAGGVRLSSATFSASAGTVANAQSYSLWVDTDGDYTVDTVLQRATARDGLVAFDTDYLIPGAEECEIDADCRDGQKCAGCRCTTPGNPLNAALVTPILYGRKCIDSDNGKNGLVKGATTNVRLGTRTYVSWQDTCLKDWADRPAKVTADPMKLLEGYCPSPSSYGQVTYPTMLTCPLGCNNGACREALLRSVVLAGSSVSVAYSKTFTGCASLMNEQGKPLHVGSFFCKSNETVTRTLAELPLVDGQRVKLCRSNGTSCSELVTVKRTLLCGDGIVQSPEQCDDGNASNGDGCSDSCLIQSNGVCSASSDCPPALVCSTLYGVCNRVACEAGALCDDLCRGTCVSPQSSRSSAWSSNLSSSRMSSSSWSSTMSSSRISSSSSSRSSAGHVDCQGPNGTMVSVPIGQPCPPVISSSSSSSSSFVPQPVCGNGRVEAPEQCDIGTACSDGRICEIGTCLCKPALCVTASSASSSGGCTDTDGGKNYYLFGRFTNFVFGNTVLPDFSDVCFKDNNHNPSIDPNILLEGYCGDDGFGHQEQYTCPYGCANAACLPPPASSSVSSTSSASSSSEGCAQDGQKVYGSSPFGPTHCCSKNAGIKPSAISVEDMCIAPTDGSIGTCIENWWLTCGNGTCDAGEDRCNCKKDCGGPVCGNSKVENGEECDGTACGAGLTCANCHCLTLGTCGNGIMNSASTIVFEVHADMAGAFGDSQLQLQFSSITAKDAFTVKDLSGLSINGACNNAAQGCEMVLVAQKSTLFNLVRQGSLFVSLDSQTISPRQLLAGTLGDPILRVKLHAENEDIDMTDLVINSSGGLATSVDALELWQEGATQPLAVSGDCGSADVLTTNAGTLPSVTRAFCFATDQQQLVVPKGADVKLLVRPRLKTDTNGAISGDTFALFIDHTAAANDATGTGSVRARGRLSSNNLVANDGDTSAEGEVFIGRPKAASMNMRIIGNTNSTVLSKIVTIANGGEANGTVPGGADREIGSFRFAAAANANYRNGMNTPELTDLIFTVNAINVSLASNGFKIYNKAASMSQSESCSPFSADGTPLTGTVSGVFQVQCSIPSSSVVNSMIDSGEPLTLVFLGNVTNANTAASTGGESILQISLNNFSDIRLKEFGLSSTMSHLRWKDRDNASATTWTWVEYPDSAVNSTTFRG